jgi:hypothetical protein
LSRKRSLSTLNTYDPSTLTIETAICEPAKSISDVSFICKVFIELDEDEDDDEEEEDEDEEDDDEEDDEVDDDEDEDDDDDIDNDEEPEEPEEPDDEEELEEEEEEDEEEEDEEEEELMIFDSAVSVNNPKPIAVPGMVLYVSASDTFIVIFK